MPVKPQPSNPDHTVHLQTRIPGWLKNQILDAANQAGQSLNTWVAAALHDAVNRPVVPLEARSVSVAEVIADYLHGRSTVAGCGRPWPCEGSGVVPVVVNGVGFCQVCSVRV
jgi:hypothetical protein